MVYCCKPIQTEEAGTRYKSKLHDAHLIKTKLNLTQITIWDNFNLCLIRIESVIAEHIRFTNHVFFQQTYLNYSKQLISC